MLTSQGTAVSFGGASLGRAVSVSGSFGSAAKEIRPLAANLAPDTQQYLPVYEKTTCDQTIEVEVLGSAFALSGVGTTGPLSVTNSGWSVSFGTAYLENMKVVAKVGDLLRINYSFKRSFA